MKNWMSDNSKKHYGTPNKDEILDITGKVSAIIIGVLFIAFIISMFM